MVIKESEIMKVFSEGINKFRQDATKSGKNIIINNIEEHVDVDIKTKEIERTKSFVEDGTAHNIIDYKKNTRECK